MHKVSRTGTETRDTGLTGEHSTSYYCIAPFRICSRVFCVMVTVLTLIVVISVSHGYQGIDVTWFQEQLKRSSPEGDTC